MRISHQQQHLISLLCKLLCRRARRCLFTMRRPNCLVAERTVMHQRARQHNTWIWFSFLVSLTTACEKNALLSSYKLVDNVSDKTMRKNRITRPWLIFYARRRTVFRISSTRADSRCSTAVGRREMQIRVRAPTTLLLHTDTVSAANPSMVTKLNGQKRR